MSYTPTTWATGDTVTAALLNKMEQGISDASSGGGGGGAFVVHDSNGTLDKTWQEIATASASSVIVCALGDTSDLTVNYMSALWGEEEDYGVAFIAIEPDANPPFQGLYYTTDSASGYPVYAND